MVAAEVMFLAVDGMRRAERALEQLLDLVFGGDWNDYETDAVTRSLEVYREHATATPIGAAAALRDAGFRLVHVHDHERSKFIRCSCRSRTP